MTKFVLVDVRSRGLLPPIVLNATQALERLVHVMALQIGMTKLVTRAIVATRNFSCDMVSVQTAPYIHLAES